MPAKRPAGKGVKMDVNLAVQWLAFANRCSVEDVKGWGLTDDQLVSLGLSVSRNKLLNPPRAQLKLGVFRCRWCGQVFSREWRTSRWRYCSDSHRQLAYRARKRDSAPQG
jgi:hypothetical protein